MSRLEKFNRWWERRRKGRARQLRLWRKTGKKGHRKQAGKHGRAMRKLRSLIEQEEARRRAVQETRRQLRVRAFAEAERCIGIMEQGGNNRGPEVERIIAEGGGRAGDPWCGWFCAAMYKRAGSQVVTWRWGAVRLLYPLLGIAKPKVPQKGDLVRFTFDHVGMFEKFNGDGTITTIEGNTGRSGAVSDSATGGDGVYRKRRELHLVNDYLRILK